jgi:SAM-dependent methyltransferase
VAHQFLQSVYTNSTHPAVKDDADLLERLKDLAPGKRGLDAGCGAGARDVYAFWKAGFDIRGIDVIEENINVARELHPEIADRVSVASLSEPLPFADGSFDFVICDAVIQHIQPETVRGVTLPELGRVLAPGGVLQLMFKHGSGVLTVYDKDYGDDRSFQLYDEHEVLGTLRGHGLALVEADGDLRPGGIMYFTDPKPTDHCCFYARKDT